MAAPQRPKIGDEITKGYMVAGELYPSWPDAVKAAKALREQELRRRVQITLQSHIPHGCAPADIADAVKALFEHYNITEKRAAKK